MRIECGIINYKLIIPFIYPILFQIRRIIHEGEDKPMLEFFTNYIGYLFSGLIYLIIKYRMKKKKVIDKDVIENEVEEIVIELNDVLLPNEDENSVISRGSFKKVKSLKKKKKIDINQNEVEKEKVQKLQKKKLKRKYIYILILAIIYLIPMVLDAYNQYDFKTSSPVSLFFSIISYVILGRLILGMKIYSHQYFALIIILISNIAIILLVFIGRKNEHIILSLVFIITIVVLYCLYNNLVKRYFNVYMGSPYYFMFIIGAMSLCIIFPYEVITVIAFGKDTQFNGIFYQMEKNFEKTKLYPLIFISDILTAFLWIAGIILTIYFFTPCHFIISESISQILSAFISNNLDELSIIKRVFVYILFFVIFLGSLVYNEIFIINIGSLSTNTQKHIINRQKEETEDIKDDVYDNNFSLVE